MTNRGKRLINQSGSSLLQVMVAVAVLGVVSVGITTMISQSFSSQKMIQVRQDMIGISEDVRTQFSNAIACQSGITAGAKFDFNLAKVAYPPPIGTAFQWNGQAFSYKINNGNDVLADNTDLKSYSVRTNRLQIVNAGTVGVDPSGNQIYRASVLAQFAPKDRSAEGLKDFNSRVLTTGYFTVNPSNVIIACAQTSPADISQVAETCLSLGGSFNSATKKCEFIGAQTGNVTNQSDTEAMVEALCPNFNGSYRNGHCIIASTNTVTIGSAPSGSAPTSLPCTLPPPTCTGTCGSGPGVKCTPIGAALSCGVSSNVPKKCASSCNPSTGQWSACK